MRRRNGDLRSQLSNEELFRATGASLIHGNHLRILRDAQENYPAWEAAIQGARKTPDYSHGELTLEVSLSPFLLKLCTLFSSLV